MSLFYRRQTKEKEIIDLVKEPFQSFFKSEAISSIILLVCAILTILIYNSSLSSLYYKIWSADLGLYFRNFVVNKTLADWINNGLMSLFFLFIGLEFKREIMVGELKSWKKAIKPTFAALGGMILPAAIYLSFNYNDPVSSKAWGVPMATDLAFAFAIILLLGKRVSTELKIFFVAIALIDDIIAAFIIIFYYSSFPGYDILIWIASILVVLEVLNYIGIRHPIYYIIPGIALWLIFLNSGINTAMAGIILAIFIPSRSKISASKFSRKISKLLQRFNEAKDPDKDILENQDQHEAIQSIEIACHHAEPPMQRMEHTLRPWVIFLIIPLFVLANSNISFSASNFDQLLSPTSIGIIAGSLIGKPLGILLFLFIVGLIDKNNSTFNFSFREIIGIGFLAGIGFSMSIFKSIIAIDGSEYMSIIKLSILISTIAAGLIGFLILKVK